MRQASYWALLTFMLIVILILHAPIFHDGEHDYKPEALCLRNLNRIYFIQSHEYLE